MCDWSSDVCSSDLILVPVPHWLDYCSFVAFKMGSLPTLFFFVKIIWVISVFLHFHMSFRITFVNVCKKSSWNFEPIGQFGVCWHSNNVVFWIMNNGMSFQLFNCSLIPLAFWKINYLVLAVMGLHCIPGALRCCAWAFSSWGERGLLCSHGVWTSRCSDRPLQINGILKGVEGGHHDWEVIPICG